MQLPAKPLLISAACLMIAALMIPSCKQKTKEQQVQTGRFFYVDGQTGDDGNDGRSPEQAWKTLAAVNDTEFVAGDTLLFKAGTVYQGQLKPQGSGRLVDGYPQPIVIDRYGEGNKPRIDAGGSFESALFIHNVEYWEINNLELTNKGPEPKARRKGVYVHIDDYGTASHIHLRNLYIHDVNGTCRKRDGHSGGIRWRTHGENVPSRLNGFLVENCHIVRCERDGIMGSGHTQRGVDWFPSLNVVVRGNLIEEVPGDGIVPISCDGALVEHNVIRNCTRRLPQGDAAAGIWPWACNNTVIQFNEVSDHKAPWDAQGFDSDWDCRNTLIQYNYSHDNEGGFLLICNNGGAPANMGINTGTVVRYNISVNDGLRAFPARREEYFSPTFHISGPTKDTKIYNNVIYVPRKPDEKIDRTMIKMDNWGGPWPEDTWFANNIFYAEGETNYDWGESKNHRFENNLFYGIHNNGPDDSNAILEDPLFVSPESAGAGWETLKGFMLTKDSPCIGRGLPISPGHDFWGHILPERLPVSVGAHEFGAQLDPSHRK